MRRRPNRTGSIVFSRGRWTGAIRLDGRRLYVYGASRAEVARKLADLARAGRAPRRHTPPTLGDHLAHWLADQPLRPRTRAAYTIIAHRWTAALGTTHLDALTPEAIRLTLRAWGQQGLSDGTLRNYRAVLAAALNAAVRAGLLERSPLDRLRFAQPRRREPPPITPALVQAVLDALRGTSVDLPARVTIATGLRLGELLGLAWPDLDLEAGLLTVSRQLQRVDRQYVLLPPKTRAGQRVVPLNTLAREALLARRAEQEADQLRAGARWSNPDQLVWTTRVGRPRAGSVLTHQLQEALAAAGLPLLRWHDLRHATATLLLAAGVNPRVAQAQLGHTSVGVTLDLYSHVPLETLRDATARLDALLRDRPT